ncbi:MAG: c-type cytochrome biogenesis protein CcmI, partial [Pseudomonadota bacterium]
YPLIRSSDRLNLGVDDSNIEFLRARRLELGKQLEQGKLSQSEYDDLIEELESNLALEMKQAPDAQKFDKPLQATASHAWSLVIIVLVVVGSVAVYLINGEPDIISKIDTQDGVDTNVVSTEVTEMVRQMEARLEAQPNDSEGWLMLGRTQLTLGNYAQAETAFLRLLSIEGPSASLYASLADASALAQQGNLTGMPKQYIDSALELEPTQPQALWLAGLHATQIDNPAQAIEYWNTLLPQLAGVPDRQAELAEIIRELEQNTLMNSAGSSTPANGLDQQTQQDSTAQPTSKYSSSETVAVNVTVSGALRSMLTPETRVFVLARAEQGPRAPLAVQRHQVKDLPLALTLSESDAMMENFNLSLFDQVVVQARISLSGDPVARPGDLESLPIVVTVADDTVVDLLIDQVVE